MTAQEIIEKYIAFFEKKGHKRIANAPLVPENDPTTLFTSSGMQPLVPYLLGETHPMGKRLVNVQNSFRAQDIDEVGDSHHTTFFRMLGNWSLGDYFKQEQLPWIWEFVTRELKISANKLYVTVFKGYKEIQKDTASEKIWTEIFAKEKLNPKERIFFYDTKNWWSRAGEPDKMPAGEPGGPDSEIFFKFDVPHNPKFGKDCHPNCECGRFMEIVNSVFMEYQKQEDGSFKKLPQQNVDHGSGVERLLAAVENQQDIFQTSLFFPIIKSIEKMSNTAYQDNKKAIRVIIDHLIASVFVAANGVAPSNKDQGYILRRLLRRAIRYGRQLKIIGLFTAKIGSAIIDIYSNTDSQLIEKKQSINSIFTDEEEKFEQVIQDGLKISEKIFVTKIPIDATQFAKIMQITNKKDFFRNIYRSRNFNDGSKFLSQFGINIAGERIKQATISGKEVFNLYQSFGFPIEMVIELAQEKRLFVDVEDFHKEVEKHQRLSRKGAEKKFAGGLADHSEKTIMGHTATHLLHQAIRDILGNKIYQSGSNITTERVRFDFNFERKLTDAEIQKIEKIVNQKIDENLPVHFEIIPLEKAKKLGAIGLFDEKYSDKVKVYFVGNYSKEFCGGPHVMFTSEIKSFKIFKQENIGKRYRRIYAKVDWLKH